MIRRLVVAVVLVTLFATACGDDASDPGDDTPGEDDAITLEVLGDQLVGGVREESVSLGDPVTIEVTGDSADQVHVHGYDRYIELVDGRGELTFNALIPGIFEIELESAGRLLIRLEVS